MDEAERCEELVYIAYGRVLAQGTPAELLTQHEAANLEDVFVKLIEGAEDNFA